MSNDLLRRNTTLPNGPAAAAILAAGAGSATLGMLALAADASPTLNRQLAFYPPSGALSGVTTLAILTWIAAWCALARRWNSKQIDLGGVSTVAFALLIVGILLTFPPVMDLLQGK